eukprot:MONOS_16379.1-p1 / transcript=MONOS_16379.1 / gene=MONOS_16379 / organism=Monocercomonoides_exilis_PA203 / gene_product=unspecified product / transcript_product=unspecified product / location=Mono_scaffold01690:2871-5286(+) / protein_length=762 / sequence_SO=supercontig / SO=protein_coding / is_pseudo=false
MHGTRLTENSLNGRELDYPEGTWRETIQNSKYRDDNLFDTYIDGKKCGVRETWKEERMMKKFTKQWNEGRRRIEKVQKSGFCDEWKIWGKEGVCGGSGVEGCLILVNSSMKLNLLRLREMGGESVLRASDESFVELSGCVIGVEREMPPFDFCGSCGLFTNISLRSSSTSTLTSTEQIFPPLFSSKAVEGEISENCFVSICSSHFSSFCISSAPFLSSPSIPLISLSHLLFFNISTANDACSSSSTTSTQTSCLMSSCSFSSVCDAYDGGIIPSLNNPLTSLTASNTSFVGCCRTKNVVCEGTSDGKLTPGRQNETFNEANSFTWCEWDGSKTTGESDSYNDGTSSGGAICMYNLGNGILSVSHCTFKDCFAFSRGGGFMCYGIDSVYIENNLFNVCTAQNQYGGALYICAIKLCARICGCDFHDCKAYSGGGVSNTGGGGMCCATISTYQFKMRSVQFISCSVYSYGGGLYFYPNRATAPNDKIYCCFLFFHECYCRNASAPFGHNVEYADDFNIYLNNGNPFYECYTTNSDDQRMCYSYNYSNGNTWLHQHTEKKDWLKDKIIYVSVNGSDATELCGANESNPCLTVKKGFEMCEIQISLTITLMGGNHTSETATVEIGTKKISVIGKGRTESSIGTGALLPTGALFSVSTGHLGLLHMKVDCNSIADSSSPNVAVVSDGGGSLSLEDVVITTSNVGEYVISSSVFVVALSQLSMVGVEIKDMNVSESLFSESVLSFSSSSSSSALLLTVTASGKSMMAN